MRKEVLFAILAGLCLGLILAFGVWRVNVALRSKNTNSPENIGQKEIPNKTLGVTLVSFENFDVTSENPINLSGLTQPSLFVAISSEENDYVIKSATSGEFNQEIPLIEGVNEILLTAFTADGEIAENKLLIVYSTEFEKQVSLPSNPTPTDARVDTSTPSNEIRERVQEKVELAKKVPKFVMGSVTDKLAAGIEIREKSGEIKQISLGAEGVTFVKTGKNRQEVKFADLAIGDFIVAMGFANNNGVLDGRRILITEEFTPSGRISLLGTLHNPKKSEVILKTAKSNEELLIKNSKDLVLLKNEDKKNIEIDFSDLDENQQVIVTGVRNESGLSARTIVVVDQSNNPQ